MFTVARTMTPRRNRGSQKSTGCGLALTTGVGFSFMKKDVFI